MRPTRTTMAFALKLFGATIIMGGIVTISGLSPITLVRDYPQRLMAVQLSMSLLYLFTGYMLGKPSNMVVTLYERIGWIWFACLLFVLHMSLVFTLAAYLR
jgi:hypothetical protein